MTRISLVSFKQIRWDNGREVGIQGGRTLYFNGLPRTLKQGGALNIQNVSGAPWQWHQTFGFDTAGGANGQMVALPIDRQQVEIAMDISRCRGQFLKLEVIGDKPNQNEELWVLHPDQSAVAFTPDRSGLLWTAALSPRVGNDISKVQFGGQLDVLDMDLQHIDIIA